MKTERRETMDNLINNCPRGHGEMREAPAMLKKDIVNMTTGTIENINFLYITAPLLKY